MNKFAIEIKWGIRYIFVYLAWVFLEKYSGAYDKHIGYYFLFSLGFYLFAFLIYILAIKDKKEHFFSNIMEWKQGCVSGIYLTMVIAVLMPFAQVIIHKAIVPEFFPNMVQHALASKNSKPEAVKAYFNLSSYIWQSIFQALSVGVVYAAIVARFLRTRNLKK
jgi:hypothetical protein